jgi:DNA-binding GntR family transcriptional regulator
MTKITEAKKLDAKPPRRTSTDNVYEVLRQKVIDSELTPGSQLLEQELAIMLGVSRTPIREALVRLQNEGLVEVIPRHGVRIVPMSISDMKEIYEILISLEPMAAELIATRGPSEEELAQLEAACERMTETLDRDEIEQWSLADEDFHLKIIRLCGNKRLADAVIKCWDQVHRARNFTLRLRPHPQPRKSIEEHYEIIDAIRRGDGASANALFRKHRERGMREQIDILKTFRIHQI